MKNKAIKLGLLTLLLVFATLSLCGCQADNSQQESSRKEDKQQIIQVSDEENAEKDNKIEAAGENTQKENDTSSDKNNDDVTTEHTQLGLTEALYTGNGSAWSADLLKDAPSSFNNDLALVCAHMSEESEDTSDEKIRKLYEEYGIKDVETYHYEAGNSLTGGGAFSIGQDELYINNVKTKVLIVTARGSTTKTEFIGDLFKGWAWSEVCWLDGEAVWSHVWEFRDKIYDGLNEYFDSYPELRNEENLKIVVTGHSLGGAAANCVGANILRDIDSSAFFNRDITKNDVYVYTFGTIKVIEAFDNAEEGYENIHNIYNYYDSFGPYGVNAATNASSLYSKFGHTEIFYSPKEEGHILDSQCHNMSTYIEALEKEKAEGNTIKYACQEHNINLVQEGEYISMGRYGQDVDFDNEPEPIEWRILKIDPNKGKMLVVSKYGLDVLPFNTEEKETKWEDSSIRVWLNTDFYDEAFNDEEKADILLSKIDNEYSYNLKLYKDEPTEDRVFLLSIKDIKKYFNLQNEKSLKPTTYAYEKGHWSGISVGDWWLRNCGEIKFDKYSTNILKTVDVSERAAIVESDGDVYERGDLVSDDRTVLVRPAMWVKINIVD